MKLFLKILKPFWWLFLIAITFLTLETFMDLLQPMLVAKLIDQGIMASDLQQVRLFGLLMLLVTFIGMVGALVRNAISAHVSYLFAKNLRDRVYAHLLSMEYEQVIMLEEGGLVTRITSDVNMLMQFINGLMRIFLKAPLLAIGSFVMVLNLDRKFLIIYLVILPLVVFLTMVQIKIGYPLFGRIQQVLDVLNQRILEFLGGIRAVRAFDRFEKEKAVFSEINKNYTAVTIETERKMSIFGPLIMLIINLGILTVIFASKTWISQGVIGVGQVVAFANYMTQFMFGMSVISRVFNIFVRAKASAVRIMEVFDLPTLEVREGVGDLVQQDNIGLDILFDRVSFAYGQAEPVFKEVSFRIKAGERVGVIGPTGCGKTSLIMCLMGLFQPSEGRIFINGQEIRSVSRQSLLRKIGFVPQRTSLFSGTLRDNLLYGNPEAGDGEIEKALDMACATEFVLDKEYGLETRIGKNGVTLSGGQKQRLSIARALIKNPALLILDDSTSALDSMTEQLVKRAIHNQGGLTLMVVAQKVTSVMDLDGIMVLGAGGLEDYGTHEELLTRSGFYRALYQAQRGGDMDAGK